MLHIPALLQKLLWSMCRLFKMQRTLERITGLEGPMLGGERGRGCDSMRVQARGWCKAGREGKWGGGPRKQTSFNAVGLGWLSSSQFQHCFKWKKTLIRKSHLFPNKLYYSAKYLYWISLEPSHSQLNIAVSQLNLLKGVLLMAHHAALTLLQKNKEIERIKLFLFSNLNYLK